MINEGVSNLVIQYRSLEANVAVDSKNAKIKDQIVDISTKGLMLRLHWLNKSFTSEISIKI